MKCNTCVISLNTTLFINNHRPEDGFDSRNMLLMIAYK
jgi:hypothetical protein